MLDQDTCAVEVIYISYEDKQHLARIVKMISNLFVPNASIFFIRNRTFDLIER